MRYSLALLLLAAAAPAAAEPRKIADPGAPQMVVIPGGTFRMGADRAEPMRGGEARSLGPVRTVTVRSFALGRTEVTNAEFAAFVSASGYRPASACGGSEVGRSAPARDWRDPGYGRAPRGDEPVVCVSWRDATAYAAWLSQTTGQRYRLPSEAEWEYAARAGSTDTWPWGARDSDICRYANMANPTQDDTGAAPENVCDDDIVGVAPVARYAADRFGVHDMLGNVWEWVADCSIIPYPALPVDGRAIDATPCEKRAVRGGSWRSRLSRHRPEFRGRDPETLQSQIFGFRVARDL